jgi:hypothetical protein
MGRENTPVTATETKNRRYEQRILERRLRDIG